MKVKPTHYLVINSDGSSHIRQLTNTPPASKPKPKRTTVAPDYDPVFSKAVAVQCRAELLRRQAARFGFVRGVLVGDDSILDD